MAALHSARTFVHLRCGALLRWWPHCICRPRGASISITIKPPLQGYLQVPLAILQPAGTGVILLGGSPLQPTTWPCLPAKNAQSGAHICWQTSVGCFVTALQAVQHPVPYVCGALSMWGRPANKAMLSTYLPELFKLVQPLCLLKQGSSLGVKISRAPWAGNGR